MGAEGGGDGMIGKSRLTRNASPRLVSMTRVTTDSNETLEGCVGTVDGTAATLTSCDVSRVLIVSIPGDR